MTRDEVLIALMARLKMRVQWAARDLDDEAEKAELRGRLQALQWVSEDIETVLGSSGREANRILRHWYKTFQREWQPPSKESKQERTR